MFRRVVYNTIQQLTTVLFLVHKIFRLRIEVHSDLWFRQRQQWTEKVLNVSLHFREQLIRSTNTTVHFLLFAENENSCKVSFDFSRSQSRLQAPYNRQISNEPAILPLMDPIILNYQQSAQVTRSYSINRDFSRGVFFSSTTKTLFYRKKRKSQNTKSSLWNCLVSGSSENRRIFIQVHCSRSHGQRSSTFRANDRIVKVNKFQFVFLRTFFQQYREKTGDISVKTSRKINAILLDLCMNIEIESEFSFCFVPSNICTNISNSYILRIKMTN